MGKPRDDSGKTREMQTTTGPKRKFDGSRRHCVKRAAEALKANGTDGDVINNVRCV